MTQARQPFREIWDKGYHRLVPIVPPDAPVSEKSTLAKRLESRGKAPGILGSDGTWRGLNWQKHETTEADLDTWAAMGAGVGIRTGEGLIALDIDSTNDLIAHSAMKLATDLLGPAPHRVGRWPKAIMIYRTTDKIPYQRVEFTGGTANERIELLTEGKQFVAYGIHPGVKRPYEWPAGLSAHDKLTFVTLAQIEAYFAELTRILPAASRPALTTAASDRSLIDQGRLLGDESAVAKAVTALPNTTELFPTYDDYIRVGAAIKGATQDNPALGQDLFCEWASRWEGGNTDDQALADYSRIKPPYELGAKWLYDMADRYNPTGFNMAEHWFQPIADAPAGLFPAEAPTPAKRFKRVKLADAADLTKAAFARPLIKGLLDQGAASVIYGQSNTGKTFVAMDMGFHSSAGLPWAGMKTAGLPTLYVAAEGGQAVRKRAAALTTKYAKDAPRAKFELIMSSIDLFKPDADVLPLIEACNEMEAEHGMKVGLVVIDTLARAMTGGDENSAKDMGSLVRNIDEIRNRTLAHVMIVHHSGKDATRGARGSNALLGAVDTEIEIADNTISVTKQRDLDKQFSVRFALDIIPLIPDADGDPMSSCVIRLLAGNEVAIGIATPKEMEVYDALATLEALCSAGKPGVPKSEIEAYLAQRPDKMSGETVRTHLRNLAAKRLVVRVGRGNWTVKAVEKASTALLAEIDDDNEAVESGRKTVDSVFA